MWSMAHQMHLGYSRKGISGVRGYNSIGNCARFLLSGGSGLRLGTRKVQGYREEFE